jgi:nicotinamidase-related amidase
VESPIYDPARTALVLVDPYNDFLSPEGKVWPLVRDVAEMVGTVGNLRSLKASVKAAGLRAFVAPHRAYRPGDTAGWKHARRPHRTLRERELYAAGTIGGSWFPDLAPDAGDVVCTEHWGFSGFAHTDLDQQLRQHGIDTILLAGMTAPGCVEGTGRYAMELGYAVTLVKDATAAFDAEYLHAAVELTGPLYAESVATTAEVIADLGGISRTGSGSPVRSASVQRPA